MSIMNTLLQQFSVIVSQIVSRASEKFIVLLPEALLAILFIFIGWIVAVIVHHIVLWVLNFLAIDKLADKTPLSGFLRSVGIEKRISEILGLLVFWLIIFFTLVVASDTLHLSQVSYALALIARFIPQVIAAVLVIIVGTLLAKFLQILTVQTLGQLSVPYRKSIGGAVQALVLVVVFIAALGQLGFQLDYVLNAFVTIACVVLLMLGLALALGSRTVLDNCISCKQLKRQIPEGTRITVGPMTGTVKSYTMTSVILDCGGQKTVMPASELLTKTYVVHSA